MNEAIKKRIRPLVLPCLHGWQSFYDRGRGKLREYRAKLPEYGYRLRMIGNRPVIAQDVRGIRFLMYPSDLPNFAFLTRRAFGAAEFKAMSHLLQPGDIAFDVGAYIGFYSVFLSQLCGPSGRVWAFEPVSDTYRRLRETLALNRCENVVPIQAAVSNRPGTATMSLFEPQFADLNTLGSPSAAMANWNPATPVELATVRACTLDDFCETEGIQRINFLKVDVEGFESAVFRGAERLLREHRVDHICFEIFQPALKDAGLKSRDVFASLEAHGYGAYSFDPATGAFHGPIPDTPQELNNFFASCRDLSRLGELVPVENPIAHQTKAVGRPT